MIETDTAPEHTHDDDKQSIWIRGLIMIAFAIFFAVARTLLMALAVVQFLWVVITKETNVAIADFGTSMSKWVAGVTKFQTFASDERPFPWAPWPSSEDDDMK